MNRCSDLTMGDFWTVDDYIVQFNDNKGTSLLYVNTKKGMELVRTIRSNFYIKKVPEEELLSVLKEELVSLCRCEAAQG